MSRGCEHESLATVGRSLSLTFGERLLLPMGDAAICYVGSGPKARRLMLADARRAWADHRASHGMKRSGSARLLTAPTAQPKLGKSRVSTYGLSLLPATGVGNVMGRATNLCPAATSGCREVCLNLSGKGVLNSVQQARLVRTLFLLQQPEAAGVILAAEILRAAERHGEVRIRLNVLSDVRWELVLGDALVALRAKGVRFYDYTKWAPALRAADGLIHLTYSASERWTDADISDVVAAGHNVAVVFAASKEAVKRAAAEGRTWHGHLIVDGLSTDDRTTDPSGVVVGLAALGKGRDDTSGFVRPFLLDLRSIAA